MHDDADTPQITASRYHANVARLELDVIGDLAGSDVDFDAVLSFDDGIRISDGASVGGCEIRNPFGADANFFDDAKLVSRLFLTDTMDLVSSFDVVDEPEVLSALLHFDDVHESGRVSVVGLNFPVRQSVLETIPQEKRERQTFAELVGTGRGSGGVTSSQFVQHPMLGRRHALHVLTGTANHFQILYIFKSLWEILNKLKLLNYKLPPC